MNRLELIEKFESETELPATWNTGGYGGYTKEYIDWLEQQLVNLCNLPVVSARTYDPDYEEVDCDHYEYQQMPDDAGEVCQLGIGIENCTHCYKNKALYVR